MFRTSPGPSSGGTNESYIPDSQLYRITSTKFRINTVVPPDDRPGEVPNM